LAGPGLRERKRAQTFAALQDAAQRLVAERGLDAVTVEQIATAAEVSPRTFFNYFDSKHAAVVDPAPGVADAFAAALAARPAGEPPLLAYRAAAVEVFLPQAEQLQRMAALVHANPALLPRYRTSMAMFEQIVVDWVAARTGSDARHSVYPRMFAATTTTTAASMLSLDLWDPDTGADGLAVVLTEVLDVLQRGLDNP
jgi:AcrR family transcriptional regulator